jgi:hypothetical protein
MAVLAFAVNAVPFRLPLPNCINLSICWGVKLMQFGCGLPWWRSGHDLREADVRR